MKKRFTIIPLIIAGSLIPGCTEESDPAAPASPSGQTTVEDVKKEMDDAVAATKDLASQKKDELIASYSAMLTEIDGELDALAKKAEDLQGDAKTKAEAAITSLKEKRDQAGRELAKLKDSAGEAWSEVSEGMSKSVDALKKAVNDAGNELN